MYLNAYNLGPMRFLEMSLICEANAILNDLDGLNLYMEAYSCKYTKKQKKRQKFRNMHSHLSNTLELANLSNERKIRREEFTRKHFSDIKNEIFLVLMRYKIIDAEKILKMITICIQSTIGLNDTLIFSFVNRYQPLTDNSSNFCFLFYNKKKKRVVLLTVSYEMNKKERVSENKLSLWIYWN